MGESQVVQEAGGAVKQIGVHVLLVVMTAVSVGCMRADVNVTVDRSGGGTVVVESYPDRPTIEAVQAFDLTTQVDDLGAVDGVTVERVEWSGNPGFRVTATAATDAELRSLVVDGVELGGRRYALFSEFEVQVDDDTWSFRAVPTSVGRELEAAALRGDAQLTETLAHPRKSPVDARLRVTVSLPGRVVDSNASSVSGASATWNLHTANAPDELFMRSEVTDLPLVLISAAGAGVVVVLLVAGLFAKIARKRRMRAGAPVLVGAGQWNDTAPAGTPERLPGHSGGGTPPIPPATSGLPAFGQLDADPPERSEGPPDEPPLPPP